ncbi:hypothetical protein [Mycolicibacterium sp.]|uniref:hypothetical protein n=1 Tax=Mycolicibacterium sp. TaxID=2320850 RepID=UPI0037CB0229
MRVGMPVVKSGGLVKFGATVGVVAAMLWSAPWAAAEPEPVPTDPAPVEPAPTVATGGEVITAPTLSLVDLGVNPVLSFYGGTSSTSLSFPVPPGLAPEALNATLDLPFAVRSGLISVTQGDKLIGKLPLPTADLSPVVIPLAGAQVVDNVATVTLTLASVPDDGYCLDRLNPVDLIDGSVAFSGAEAVPATVADFLPPLLRRLTIGVPANPSMAESDAAVQLATSLTKKYGNQAPDVQIVPLPDGATAVPTPSLPLERQIVVKEGSDESISLEGAGGVPQLLITGPASNLTNDTRLLSDGGLNLAVSPRVVPEKLSSGRRPQTIGGLVTVGQLNQGSLTAAGNSPGVTISLDQTKFGHPVQGVRVHVVGTYTPLPNTFGAQLTATVNGEQIDSWAADSAGTIDRWISVPDRLLTRYTDVQISLNTTGNTGGCNDDRSLNLKINGNSVIESSEASPPIPAGFGSLPQSLLPVVKVGIGSDRFADTVRASQITIGLQRLSSLALRTSVTSFEEARKSQDPAILISADGWTDKSIPLPVSTNERRITLEGTPEEGPTVLNLDPGIQFGSLQTVFDGHRSLLIATSNGAPQQLDDLLGWLNADRSRWPQLRGTAIVAIPGRAPALVAGRTPMSAYGPVEPAADQDAAPAGRYRYDPAWWVAAGVVGLAAAGVLAIILTARRPQDNTGGHRRDS